jgi:hypothetical protein
MLAANKKARFFPFHGGCRVGVLGCGHRGGIAILEALHHMGICLQRNVLGN